MKSMRRRRTLPRLDLDPEAVLLFQDAAVQIKKRFEAGIRAVY
jgi:hypothetical protein